MLPSERNFQYSLVKERNAIDPEGAASKEASPYRAQKISTPGEVRGLLGDVVRGTADRAPGSRFAVLAEARTSVSGAG
jgi:hypothetical protein